MWSQNTLLSSYIKLYQGTANDLVLFLRGLSKGLTGEDIGADLGECFGETEDLVAQIQEALDEIEQGGQNLALVVDGIFKMIQII